MKTSCNTAIDFAHRPAIIVMDNPLKTKEARRFKVTMGILMIVVLGVALFSQQVFLPNIEQAEAQFTRDVMKPQMMRLAEQGKVPARLWLAEYYPDGGTEVTLTALVAEGNAQAMMLKAQLLYPTNKGLALSFIRRAAQEGEPRAVKFVSDINSGDILVAASGVSALSNAATEKANPMKKRDYAVIDPQIASLVAAFNHAGFITYASCQGHGWPVQDIKPYIAFQAEMTRVRPLLHQLRQDALSTRPQLRWGWNITGHFTCELVLCFRLAPEGAHRKRFQYQRSSLLHDFKVISTWLF